MQEIPFIKPGNFFLQKFEKCLNVIFGSMWCWNSLPSGLLGPLLLKSGRIWGWFFPKTFQGLHVLFSGSLSWSMNIWAIYPRNKFDEKAQCECMLLSPNYFNLVMQIRQHVIRVYCPTTYCESKHHPVTARLVNEY